MYRKKAKKKKSKRKPEILRKSFFLSLCFGFLLLLRQFLCSLFVFRARKKNLSFVYFRLFDCENIGFIFHGNVKHFHFLFWQLVSSKHFLVDFISWWFFSHFSTLFCFEIKMFGWLLPLIKLWPLITDCNSNKKRFIF